MTKHVLNWKPVPLKTVRGTDYDSRLPEILDGIYRGTLLSEILAMEKKISLPLADAVNLAKQKWWEAFQARNGDEADRIHDNFIEWISNQGYHIELTGEEFEPQLLSDRVS